jgi:hypothetical protein
MNRIGAHIGNLVVLLALSASLGCSESTVIRSSPPGAQAFVNDRFVGVTPTVFTVPRAQFDEKFECRVELDGYEPATQNLRKVTAPGRIVGGVFTLGIVSIFKGATAFDSPHDFALRRSAQATKTGASKAEEGPSAESRLRRLQQMRAAGTITEEEYNSYEVEILRGK